MINDEISCARLQLLLDVRGEGDQWDFKRELDLKTSRGKAELARDVLAFANTGGGHMIFGVDPKTFHRVGIPAELEVDSTKVADAVMSYTGAPLQIAAASYEVDSGPGRAIVAIVYVAPHDGIAMPSRDVNVALPNGKQETVMSPTNILVRARASTRLADQGSLEELLKRLRVTESNSFHRGPRPPIHHNLPGREEIALRFVGRTGELALLWSWLKDSHRRRWLLAGDGGKGKSAIAYEFATQVVSANPQELISVIWLSAKRREFCEGKTRDRGSPDFHDLGSLLQAFLTATGFEELCASSIGDRKAIVLQHLTELPSLLIVDDIDSLEGSEDAVEFLTLDAASTKSKVLLTSRRVPYGLAASSSQVRGFDFDEGKRFVAMRIELQELDGQQFSDRVIADILKATDGSPLYVEELLRFCSVRGVGNAIEVWKKHGGDAARRYALQREFDLLPARGREIVLACCLMQRPLSFAELQAITGLDEETIHAEMDYVHRLFLIGKPRIIDDLPRFDEVPRFDVNLNTKALVTKLYEGTDVARRLKGAIASLRGEAPSGSAVAAYVVQSITMERLGKFENSEEVINQGLQRWPEHVDLIAQLGILYSRWRPRPRSNEAREHFRRAHALKSPREATYSHWWQLEYNDNEFAAAAGAAAAGLACLPDTASLLFQEGLARSRLGQELMRTQLPGRGREELELADKRLFRSVLRSQGEQTDVHRKSLRALWINAHALKREGTKKDAAARWAKAFPDAPEPWL
ncbi:MAG TPA: ATP-binding protein [Polyangiaceae bacterium]|nr:ATP-binding protein [Polyangiaceae bacterium]